MSSRRISSYSDLKPIQAVTVDAFSKFNSENINRLTRIVSKSGNNDVVVNGLDVYGVDDPISIKSSNLLNGCTWTGEGCTYKGNYQFEFDKKEDSKYYEWIETTIDSDSIPSDGRYSGYFELQFSLHNATPTYLVFNLNKHVIDLKHLDMFVDDKTGLCKLIFKYDFNFDEVFVFRIGMYLDTNDSKTFTTNQSKIILKNVSLQQIFDNSKLDYYLSQEASFELDAYGSDNVHPIHELAVTKGVAIKDDVTVDFLKSNFNNDNQVVKLEVNNPNSWILGNPYTCNDFTELHASFTPQKAVFGNDKDPGDKLWVSYQNQRLMWQVSSGNEITMTDDFKTGSNDYNVSSNKTTTDGVVKLTYNQSQIHDSTKWLVGISNNNIILSVCNPSKLNTNTIEFNADSSIDVKSIVLKGLGDIVKVNGTSYARKLVKWAYVVVYSSYFKNPVSNQNYIGLIRSEDLEKPEYREDYLILAKVRFIDPLTADIITYSNSRQDLGVITAEDVNYGITCKNGEIWNDDVPNTTGDALDILRLKQIENLIKERYKHDYDAEISDAYNLVKLNNFDSKAKAKINTDDYSHILRKTVSNTNKIKVVSVEKDKEDQLYFTTIPVGSIFTLNTQKTHYIFTDTNGDKWAVQSDFKAFGKYNELDQGDKIYRKYLGFNTVGPFKYIDKDTKLPVIEFDWNYAAELRIPTSVETGIDSTTGNLTTNNQSDVKDDYFLSYHPDESSSVTASNDNKNHTQFILFRNNLLTTKRIGEELDFLPNEAATLLNRRVLYGLKDTINGKQRVRIYSSRHQLDNSMADYHIMTGLNNDSSLVEKNNDGIVDKSTKFVFDGDRPDNKFRTKTFLTSKTEGDTKVIIDTNYYYKNLIDDRITISTNPDDNRVYHIQSSSYDFNDLKYQYWFKPDAQVMGNKLHLRIDTEKNFIIRLSDIIDFLYDYCKDPAHSTKLSTFINGSIGLNNRKMIDIIVDIDCTISRLRDLDRRLDGGYETIDKYFKSKLLLINDSDENKIVSDDLNEYFINTFVNASFSLFYYPDNSNKYVPFRTAYTKTGNYITRLGFDQTTILGRTYIDDSQFVWKDDRRGWNNAKIGDTSKLELYPATSKAKTDQTVADYIDDSDNNAFNKARGPISHTYAGCRTEFTFEYIKRNEPQDPNCLLKEYGIENSIDQITDPDIESETSDEKFNHNVDKLYAQAEYYTIPNARSSSPAPLGDNSNWIFTTDNGVISVLNQDDIVSDALDELEFKEFISKTNDNYSEDEITDLNDFNEYSNGLAHVRYHILDNVNNKNNGCLNLKLPNEDNAENFRWIFSWEGTTGIWRSTDFKAQNRLSLITTSNISGSSTFDVKQMVTWKDGDPEGNSCVIVLSSQNKSNLSSVEVIPYNSILAVNEDGTNKYKYLCSKVTNPNIEGIEYSSFVGSMKLKNPTGEEFGQHMLVNNICIADDSDGNDLLMYIGKQRKDKYRFPPEDQNGKCSDTPHHGSLIRNSVNPDLTHTTGTGKKKKTIIDVAGGKIVEEGIDISTNYISIVRETTVTNGKKLIFDKQEPATSTINTIYSLHLGEGNNRFLSIGSANNLNTGIDWELTSYYSYGNPIPDNADHSAKYGDSVLRNLNSRYGIPKSIYEYDKKIYIVTTNGIAKLIKFNADTSDSSQIKFLSFESELKFTKWRVPYNYGNSAKNRNGNKSLMLTWSTSTPKSSNVFIDENNITDIIKISDGVYAMCGLFFAGIYTRDKFTFNTAKYDDNNKFLDIDDTNNYINSKNIALQNPEFPVPALVEYDKYNNTVLNCGLQHITSSAASPYYQINNYYTVAYNRNTRDCSKFKSSIRQVVTVGEMTENDIHKSIYATLDKDRVVTIRKGYWNGAAFDWSTKLNNNSVSSVLRLAYFNHKIYCFRSSNVIVCDETLAVIKTISVSGNASLNISKIVCDFDSMFFLRETNGDKSNTKRVTLSKITNDTFQNIILEVDSYSTKYTTSLASGGYRIGITFYGKDGKKNLVQGRIKFPWLSKYSLSKFKNNSIVINDSLIKTQGGDDLQKKEVDHVYKITSTTNSQGLSHTKPLYYNQFSNEFKSNVAICADRLERAYPTFDPVILPYGIKNGTAYSMYPLINHTPFPYYNLIYDRNIDCIFFSVDCTYTYGYMGSCCI